MFSLEHLVDLPLVWYGLIIVAIFLYILLDGFDLGVGVLFPFAPSDQSRDHMMNSIAPFWDGNETWLVLGGGGLFAAFPLAYAILMPALYIPASTGGVTCPVTPAGAVALDNAGVLLGLVLSQLRREGAPYIMTGMQPSPMDMRTMTVPYADPQRGIFQALAHLYRLPSFGWGGVSDSKTVDEQAAAEAALTLLAESLAGGNIIHDLGYLESGLTFSLVQLAICEELIAGMARNGILEQLAAAQAPIAEVVNRLASEIPA